MKRAKLTILVILMAFMSCSDFKKESKPLFKNLLELYIASATKCETTQQVWSSAIFKKKYALSTSTKFDDTYEPDFNIAIQRMEGEQFIMDLNKKIELLRITVKKELKDISDTKHESYDRLITLYSNIEALSNSALSPSGNYQSYSDDIQQKENQINMLITEFKARNPDLEK